MRKVKKVGRKIARLVVSGTLASSPGAFATPPTDTLDRRAGTGDTETVLLQSLPVEVQSGSIRISEDDHASGLSAPLALVSADEAARIAARTASADVLGAVLDVENGFLIWAVDVQSTGGKYTTLIVDAGTGQVLALASG